MGPTRFASAAVSVPFAIRRFMLAILPRLINRRFAFALAAAAILVTKVAHVYFHLDAIPTRDLIRWGSSFFLQDTLVLVILRVLIDGQAVASIAASFFISFVVLLAFISLTFATTAGSELQWRNVTLAGDSSSWGMMVTGLVSAALVLAGLLVLAAVSQAVFYTAAGIALDILKWPVSALLSRFSTNQGEIPATSEYKHLPQKDLESSTEYLYQSDDGWESSSQDTTPAPARSPRLLYVVVGVGIFAQIFTTLLRPDDTSLVYMSWTLPLMPFVDFAHSSSSLSSLLASSSNVNGTLDNATALTKPIQFSWLPKDTPLPGFEDWYTEGKEHYSAQEDPLKISNLDDPLLPALRDINLADVPIRHVMLIKLESTRKDVFPIKKSGKPYTRLAGTHKNKTLPEEANKLLANLTPAAKFLTGDHDDGFEGNDTKPEPNRRRGGINANNAFTTSTYTLKSLAGTLCGLSPLAADFNLEHAHHVYQPCLPHIFGAFNSLDHSRDHTPKAGAFTPYKWRSSFMQSVTFRYDKQDKLMPRLGYTDENLMDWWYLKGTPKFGPVNISDVNYYGMPEVAIEDYIRDAFDEAKKNNERVFLSHLTSTTHHAFGIPEEEKYVPLTEDKDWNDLSHYLNAVGYVDRWLQKILGILDEKGVANETLLVLVGDHGLSIAEKGTITPYSNPHVANYHVPLVLSHPKLPQINIDDAVHSTQILPTILDLLVETGSLSKSKSKAARDLARNYEGQSLLRPLRKFSERNSQGAWQITVMNPGGSTLAVRDARQPNWRLIVPVFGNYEWRFTDLTDDPHEEHPISSFDLKALMRTLGSENGTDTSRWVEEAAVVTRWWANENYKRWRFHP
ncbi:sulfatase domain-containingprotein [Purpureocillium lilacinum]|uniref:Sulfatase domain-containingprotein n=1 Tax=Purpureocillium lilacinum TaxID=33203 RepID=A0A179GJ32_PURLI|nr:sulfatase domain-containingprotein [Purpureocillium lilacinum]OAQ77864.1 sulfatase domain-containingprotein [Purpureocillium lilacinum]